MNILGLNVFHADTSACLIKDGKLISAVEEREIYKNKTFYWISPQFYKFLP